MGNLRNLVGRSKCSDADHQSRKLADDQIETNYGLLVLMSNEMTSWCGDGGESDSIT